MSKSDVAVAITAIRAAAALCTPAVLRLAAAARRDGAAGSAARGAPAARRDELINRTARARPRRYITSLFTEYGFKFKLEI